MSSRIPTPEELEEFPCEVNGTRCWCQWYINVERDGGTRACVKEDPYLEATRSSIDEWWERIHGKNPGLTWCGTPIRNLGARHVLRLLECLMSVEMTRLRENIGNTTGNTPS